MRQKNFSQKYKQHATNDSHGIARIELMDREAARDIFGAIGLPDVRCRHFLGLRAYSHRTDNIGKASWAFQPDVDVKLTKRGFVE